MHQPTPDRDSGLPQPTPAELPPAGPSEEAPGEKASQAGDPVPYDLSADRDRSPLLLHPQAGNPSGLDPPEPAKQFRFPRNLLYELQAHLETASEPRRLVYYPQSDRRYLRGAVYHNGAMGCSHEQLNLEPSLRKLCNPVLLPA